MPDMTIWMTVATFVGPGGALICGFVSWKLWNAYQAEIEYSKLRDKETMTVLGTLTTLLKEEQERIKQEGSEVCRSLQEFKNAIEKRNA